MDIFVYWQLFNWTVFWKVNRNKFRSLREIRGNVNWNFDLNFFMQKVFHKKIGNSLSYAVHMIWRIKDPFWVCILSQNQTKVLWTKAVTWQMTRERWQIDLPWHSFQQKTQYLYWKVMGVCFSHLRWESSAFVCWNKSV